MKMNRWIVTYTKHIKQKRKVYQDGILELSGDKVALYDDCENLITSRFFKKDEVIECGGMLAFETHLVDVGDPETNQLLLDDPSACGVNVKLKERDGAYGQKAGNIVDKKSTLQTLSLKNSANTVHGRARENKKKTLQSEAPPKHSDSVPSNYTEWNALYTAQITQKAKRYHDGILRLVSCGSHMNQVILLHEDGTTLSSKFLKSVECVETGRNYEFPNYLVQICEPRTLSGDNSDGVSLQKVAGCSSREMDLLTSNKNACNKPMPNDIEIEHTGHLHYLNSNDDRLTDPNTKLINEWNALYTTQKTQKAKKYHDGILQLVNCGSHMKQVILLNEDGSALGSKYLKSVECIKTGQTCEFPNYMVEICEPRTLAEDGTSKQPFEKVAAFTSTSTTKFTNISYDCMEKSLLRADTRRGHLEEAKCGINCESGRSSGVSIRPIRDALQILSSLKRPVHTRAPSDVNLLDVENNREVPEVNARKPTNDNHTGNIITIDGDYEGKPPSHGCSFPSNQLSEKVLPRCPRPNLHVEHTAVKMPFQANSIHGNDVPDLITCTSPKIAETNPLDTILDCDPYSCKPVGNESMDKIPTSSSSSPESHFDTNKSSNLADAIMALQQEWSTLSHRVSAIGNTNNPISSVQNDACSDEIPEMDRPSAKSSSSVCVAADARSDNPELQSISKTCLNVNEFPTFDLGFD